MLVVADSATILISSGADAGIDLAASAQVKAPVDIADISANFRVARQSSIGVKIIAKANLTPLFRFSAVVKRIPIIGEPIFRESGGEEQEEIELKDVDYDFRAE